MAGRAYVDTGPLLERELGQRAGLGWFGKNTMLIHPRRGSWHFLGALLLDLDLEPDPPFTADHCGSCSRCLDACPTGALLGRDSSGAPVMDATRCISYLTIEHRGPIPSELRPAIGNRVYGCDICQEVCPFNSSKFVQLTPERDYRADWRDAPDRPGPSTELPGTESPPLVELMRMTREEWDAFSRGSAIRRAGYAGFKRNVAVAAFGQPPPQRRGEVHPADVLDVARVELEEDRRARRLGGIEHAERHLDVGDVESGHRIVATRGALQQLLTADDRHRRPRPGPSARSGAHGNLGPAGGRGRMTGTTGAAASGPSAGDSGSPPRVGGSDQDALDQLIEGARAGDLPSFNRIVLRFQDRVYGLSVRMLGLT